MCGVVGFCLPVDLEIAQVRLVRMADAIRHRGPDGEGIYVSHGPGAQVVGLGHRRLSIIDLVGGAQPFTDPATGVVLSYNGELYNFVEIRDELRAAGHLFRTASDTEVVLRAYIAWGTDCFRRFRGMFALAFWDPRDKRIVLARDQFGKKPLFIRRLEGGLLFASEPKAILAYGGPPPALDLESLAEFLSWRYVPGPNTLFAGIQKIPPGSWASWDGARLHVERYFEPPYASDAVRSEPDDPVGAFLSCLDDAVRLRMASDVPFGAFLSGGLDSSAIVALMSRHSKEPVRTFSVGFKEAEHSELPYARLVAERFGTNHTELVISADDLMQHLPALVEKSDGPVSEPSNIPIWLLSERASRSVKMVLTGEGSDELLGGYPKHAAERYGAIWRSVVPSLVHRCLVEPATRVLPFRYHRIKTLASSIDLRTDEERMPRWMGALSNEERDRLLGVEVGTRRPDPLLFRHGRGRTALERILSFDQQSWLPDNLLERGDRMTMAASVEARMPFMDTALARLTASLSDRWRISGATSKYILRSAMKSVLPSEILGRPKVGFRVPVAQWFRGPMREYIHEHLDSPRSLTRSLYAKVELSRILDEHGKGLQNHEKLLWSLLNLEVFQRRYRLSSVVDAPAV